MTLLLLYYRIKLPSRGKAAILGDCLPQGDNDTVTVVSDDGNREECYLWPVMIKLMKRCKKYESKLALAVKI